jgi:hypothetical protein
MATEKIKFKKVESCFKMATIASHRWRKAEEISSNIPQLCFIYGETETSLIGRWALNLDPDLLLYYDIEFPKSSIRNLTDAEIEKYQVMKYSPEIKKVDIRNGIFEKNPY